MEAPTYARTLWWRTVVAAVWMSVPVATAVLLFPDPVGQWTERSDALWIRTVLLMSMLWIAILRSIVTKDRVEQGFLTLVILLSMFMESPPIDSERLGPSVIALLLEDRSVYVSVLVLVACVLFVVRGKKRDAPAS
jgi:hypothetical protein